MLNKNEIFAIFIVSLVLGTIVSLLESTQIFLTTSAIILVVILINVVAKKILAFYFDSELEIKLWEFKRFLLPTLFSKNTIFSGSRPHQKMKKAIPAGIFVPLILKVLTFGAINWMACLTFNIKGTIYRARRRFGLYQFTDITEGEMAIIAAGGVFANILMAIIGYLINAPLFSKMNLMFAFYNIIPISNLDGNKIFWGMKNLWIAMTIISVIGLIASMTII